MEQAGEQRKEKHDGWQDGSQTGNIHRSMCRGSMVVPGGSGAPVIGWYGVELTCNSRRHGHAYQKHGNHVAGFIQPNW
jgi:hypothetical protein